MISTLDYDIQYDQENVNLLDCLIKIRNDEFEMELFDEDTDVHLCWIGSSYHP